MNAVKKKKICFLVGYFPICRGGAEFQSLLIADAIKEKYEIFFISSTCPEETCFTDGDFKIYTLRPTYIKHFQPIYIYQNAKIARILEAEKPDMIYVRALNTNIYPAIKYCEHFNAKLFWHIAIIKDLYMDKIAFNQNYPINLIESIYIKKGILKSDYIFAQTFEQARVLKERFNKNAVQVYNFHSRPKHVIKKNYDTITVLWVANLKKTKQPYLFIELAKAFESYKNLKFIMMGKDAPNEFSAPVINNFIENINNLSYIGEISIDEVNEYFNTAHILVNTSLYEGFSNTFVQAFMNKVPVISINADPDDILERENIGFRTYDFDNLVSKLKLLIGNIGLLKNMGEDAQQFAFNNLSMSNIQVIKESFDEV